MKQLVTSLYDLYLKCCGNRESTIEVKRRASRFWLKAFGDMPVNEITYGHAEDFRNMLSGGRSAKTVNLYVKAFKTFGDWAVNRRYLTSNPFTGVPLLPEQDKLTRAYSIREVERMLDVADVRWQGMVFMGFLAGCRRGEVLNLQISDFRFDENMVCITSKQDTAETWPWDIKNRKQAYVPLPETFPFPHGERKVQLTIIEVIDSLPYGQPYVFVKPDYYQMLMRRKHEGTLNYEKRLCPWGNFDRDFKALLKRASVRPGSFQGLRVTYSDILKRCGYDLKQAQILLRHKSINTTARYYRQHDELELVKNATGSLKHYATNVP